jgi:YbbR domain-containing protein
MIKKLKRRFVLIIMSMLGIVFLFIIAAINYSNYSYSKTHSEDLLKTLIENNGEVKPMSEPRRLKLSSLPCHEMILNLISLLRSSLMIS